MRLQALQSKVARRIFWLFFISALFPLVIISLISYNYIAKRLEQETTHQIYLENRSFGNTVFDHLVSLEINLKTVIGGLKTSLDYFDNVNTDNLTTNFDSIYFLNPRGKIRSIIGEPIESIALHITAEQEQHLDDNKTLLIVDKQSNQTRFILARLFSKTEKGKSYVLGVVSNEYLWNVGIYPPEILIVLDKAGDILYSSIPVNDDLKSTYLKLDLHSGDEGMIKYWSYNGQEYATYGWDLFMAGHFHDNGFIFSYSTPKKAVYAASQKFRNIFPQILLATLFIIALLSISLIRKSLGPIEKLMHGTINIANGVYNKPVTIDSGDEFEKLGESFNHMMDQIDDQFKTLTILSKIDRLILSTMDKDHIIKTLVRYLHELNDADHVSVVTITDPETGAAKAHINSDNTFTEVESDDITVNNIERHELEVCDGYLLFSITDVRSYFKQQKILGDRSFLVYPIKQQDKLTGLICISRHDLISIATFKYKKIQELSNRVAVALTNAEWEGKLYVQAHYDALTNLPNRFLFKDRLEQAIERAERNGTNVAVMFIDIDRFKNINDSLGHSIGDIVIQKVADLLLRCVRNYDTISRIGGDEFLIIIPDIKSLDLAIKEASRVAARILKHLTTPFLIDDREIYISASIGITIFPKDSNDYDTILMNADTAMYYAKNNGRGNYQFYSSEYSQNNLKRLNLENDLRYAIEKNQLELVYQPIVDFKSGRIVSVEALIRWQHHKLGMVNPEELINIAEETNLIGKLGYWVLNKACQDNKTWQDEHDLSLLTAVNVSVEQFRQPDLQARIQEILLAHAIKPENIELEITESTTIDDALKTKDVLEKLRNLGLSTSIDDFGTGFSSLLYLQQFPVDNLKIDRSFIKDIPFNKSSRSIASAIIAMSHSLNIRVTAEGVESLEQFKLLNELNCDQVQGYFICHPLPSSELMTYIKEYHGLSHIKIEDING